MTLLLIFLIFRVCLKHRFFFFGQATGRDVPHLILLAQNGPQELYGHHAEILQKPV